MPAGVKTVSCLAGASLSFQKVWRTPRGMKTNETRRRRVRLVADEECHLSCQDVERFVPAAVEVLRWASRGWWHNAFVRRHSAARLVAYRLEGHGGGLAEGDHASPIGPEHDALPLPCPCPAVRGLTWVVLQQSSRRPRRPSHRLVATDTISPRRPGVWDRRNGSEHPAAGAA